MAISEAEGSINALLEMDSTFLGWWSKFSHFLILSGLRIFLNLLRNFFFHESYEYM